MNARPRGNESGERARCAGVGGARIALVLTVALALACALWAPQAALASFPYLGDGALGEPSSWKLAPGQVPSNLGGLRWKFAATPAIPSEHTGEEAEIEKNNSQMDELCGVTGMSLVDQFATMPEKTGSCIAAGTPIHTAFQVTLGRPDVTIAEIDSGIEWNNLGAMLVLRSKMWLNPGELPAPEVNMTKTFDTTTGVNCEKTRAATGGDYDRYGGMPDGKPGGSGPIPYDVLEQGAFNVLDYACDARVAKVDFVASEAALRVFAEEMQLSGRNGLVEKQSAIVYNCCVSRRSCRKGGDPLRYFAY